MARPVRIDVKDGWYHVCARGIERREIFLGARYGKHFLDLLGEMSARYAVRVHAYVLMGNHYHLLVQTPEANASQAMQWLNVSYSVWFNRKQGRVGHVFQGRFSSTLIEGEGSWVLRMSAYLHLNPVRVSALGLDKSTNRAEALGLVAPNEEAIKSRLKILRETPWNSYRDYAGYTKSPEWLVMRNLLSRAGGRSAYRRYVESLVTRGADPDAFESIRGRLILGGRSFEEKVKRFAGRLTKEQPDRKQLARGVEFSRIVRTVEVAKGEKWEAFEHRHGDWGRNLALYLARRRSGLTLRAMGEQAGGMEYKTVSKAIQYFEQRLTRDRKLRALTGRLLDEISNIET